MEVLQNDERVVNNIYHLLEWTGLSHKDMVTFIGKLPAGIAMNQMEVHIHNNQQLVLRFKENDAFSSNSHFKHFLTTGESHEDAFQRNVRVTRANRHWQCIWLWKFVRNSY
jgi:hypothetical protein